LPGRSLRLLTCGLAVVAVALVAGCGDDSPGPEATPTTSAPTTSTTTVPPPPTTFPPDQVDAIRDAVRDVMQDRDIGASFFLVRNLLQSPVDSNWARFNVAPTPGNETVVDYEFGVAHFDGSRWSVVALGMEDAVCGAGVPPAVQVSLQLGCS
jgi:hypothetical protein